MSDLRRLIEAAMAALALAACDRRPEVVTGGPRPRPDATLRTTELWAGTAPMPHRVANPYAGDRAAIAEGQRLYGWFNCAGCHGPAGGGGIGPPLLDAAWIYGAHPAAIYQSIVQGRPQGMPAFGRMIPDDQLWKIVAYVESLGGIQGEPPSGPSPNAESDATEETS